MTKVAFQGEAGAFSEIASKKMFGEKITVSPSFSFEDVFLKVKNGEVDFGIIPIENSLYGSVFESYDLLLKYSLSIIGELNLQINHNLLAKKNYKLSEIKKVYSHPQALGQCSEFLKKLKNTEVIPSYDTAGSALISLNNNIEPTAAIASKNAAIIYKLKILKANIQNNKENYTRFYAISKSKSKKKPEHPKSSICFELKNIPGALFKALSVFALKEINLLKIESRPIPHKPFQYIFYIDFSGNYSDANIKLAINHLTEFSLSIKKLGAYEAGKTFIS
ncbi:MAG: prephenate dehydratase [Ignavibacteriaceae bacterium]